jgi:hypothetical protein
MPNNLVASTPPKGDTPVQRLYAQAAGSVARHERVKAPPETIKLDYVDHRATFGDRRGPPSSLEAPIVAEVGSRARPPGP